MRPIKALRQFLQKHPDTKEFSSQLGLALLTGCSESLVRAVEGGRMEMSRKFAKALSVATGASKDWLMQPDVESDEVPAEPGGPLDHMEAATRVKRQAQGQTQNNLNDVAIYLRAAGTPASVDEGGKSGTGSIQRQMAASMASLVEAALCESLARGDTRLMNEITRALSRELPAEETDSETP